MYIFYIRCSRGCSAARHPTTISMSFIDFGFFLCESLEYEFPKHYFIRIYCHIDFFFFMFVFLGGVSLSLSRSRVVAAEDRLYTGRHSQKSALHILNFRVD